jgi:chemotaxis protein histidine kinase CheA
MDASAKLKEIEEEIKVLKAEIRNVLLDIREFILERANPLGEEHESAFIRMDLNTTARAVAAEAAAREALRAGEQAGQAEEAEAPASEEPAETQGGAADEAGPESPAPDLAEAVSEEEEAAGEQAAPRVIRRNPPVLPTDESVTEIPLMYQAKVPPLSGSVQISAWLTEALAAVGPRELERVIAIHRFWGNLPPNINRALAHLQELLAATADDETEPPWLRVMRGLDELASL